MAKLTKVDSVNISAISSGVLGFPKDEFGEIIIRRLAQWFALKNKLAEDIANN